VTTVPALTGGPRPKIDVYRFKGRIVSDCDLRRGRPDILELKVDSLFLKV
jgi:hypothetical protein